MDTELPVDIRTPQAEIQSCFKALEPYVSTMWADEKSDLLEGFRALDKRFAQFRQDKDWSDAEVRSVIGENLDDSLGNWLTEALTATATKLFEAVRDKRLSITEAQTAILVDCLTTVQDGHAASWSTKEQVSAGLKTEEGDALASTFGKVFLALLPNKRCRDALAKGLREYSEELKPADGNDCDGATDFSEHAESDPESDEEPLPELTWDEILEQDLSILGLVLTHGKHHFLQLGHTLRTALGNSLQKQRLYHEYLQELEKQSETSCSSNHGSHR